MRNVLIALLAAIGLYAAYMYYRMMQAKKAAASAPPFFSKMREVKFEEPSNKLPAGIQQAYSVMGEIYSKLHVPGAPQTPNVMTPHTVSYAGNNKTSGAITNSIHV